MMCGRFMWLFWSGVVGRGNGRSRVFDMRVFGELGESKEEGREWVSGE